MKKFQTEFCHICEKRTTVQFFLCKQQLNNMLWWKQKAVCKGYQSYNSSSYFVTWVHITQNLYKWAYASYHNHHHHQNS